MVTPDQKDTCFGCQHGNGAHFDLGVAPDGLRRVPCVVDGCPCDDYVSSETALRRGVLVMRIAEALPKMHPDYREDFLLALGVAGRMSLSSLEGWSVQAEAMARRKPLRGMALATQAERDAFDLMGPQA